MKFTLSKTNRKYRWFAGLASALLATLLVNYYIYMHADSHIFGYTPGLRKATYVMLTTIQEEPCGHAYAVIIPNGDESKNIPIGEQPDFKGMDSLIGHFRLALSIIFSVPGGTSKQNYYIANPTYNPTLCMKIDELQEASLLALNKKWRSHPYKLGIYDCVTLVGLAAGDVGLHVPSRLFALDPKTFVIQLALINKEKFNFVQGPLTPKELQKNEMLSH